MIKGIGCDIVDHSRINLNLANKLLTKNEFNIFKKKRNKVEYLASRFAAKEAIIKATNKIYLCKDIELINDDNGKLLCNIQGISITISHEKSYSVAFALWESNE